MRSPLPRFSLKYFLACLCRIYGQISRGETPEKMKMDDRAYTAIYEGFSPDKRKVARRRKASPTTRRGCSAGA